jgi:hypothetical protein
LLNELISHRSLSLPVILTFLERCSIGIITEKKVFPLFAEKKYSQLLINKRLTLYEMNEQQILLKLSKIPPETWEAVSNKCYGHINMKLAGKTASGAHSGQRLGMEAPDFYFVNAVNAIYSITWEWKYEKFSIDEQLIRIINSMISEQVRKYKREIEQGKKTVLIGNDQLALQLEDELDEQYDESYLIKLSNALIMACENNEKFKNFIHLKQKGFDYSDICNEMNCTRDEAYQIMETIARRARKILKSL